MELQWKWNRSGQIRKMLKRQEKKKKALLMGLIGVEEKGHIKEASQVGDTVS